MKKHAITGLVFIFLVLLLAGCMYPQERRLENQVPSQVYLEMTQKAVDLFREKETVLPLVTRPMDTQIFEKYEIDFQKLIPRYLPDAPGNSFEKGGIFKYVLIDVETKPTVKLAHLGAVSTVANVQQAVNRFRAENGYLPVGKEVGYGYFSINYKQIGMKEQTVESVYSPQLIPLILNKKGEVGIDYTSDIATFVRQKKTLPQNVDPRYELARNSLFVPVKSFPYTWSNGQPHLMEVK